MADGARSCEKNNLHSPKLNAIGQAIVTVGIMYLSLSIGLIVAVTIHVIIGITRKQAETKIMLTSKRGFTRNGLAFCGTGRGSNMETKYVIGAARTIVTKYRSKSNPAK
jgi:hypothetical protein